MIDHVDILKDGASAVYGSDAIAGVVNFFLIHKFRGLEIGANCTGTQTWEHPTRWASGRHGLKRAPVMTRPISWSLPISGSASMAFSVVTATFLRNGDFTPFGGFDVRSSNLPGRSAPGFRLNPGMFFGPAGLPIFGVNTPLPHSAPNASHSPFYKIVPSLVVRNWATNVALGRPPRSMGIM